MGIFDDFHLGPAGVAGAAGFLQDTQAVAGGGVHAVGIGGRDAHEFGVPDGLISQSDLSAAGLLNDVIIGDDVPILVPDKSRTAALRDLKQI